MHLHGHDHHTQLGPAPVPEADRVRLQRAYGIAIALNLGFVILEVLVGRLSHSLGLVSDAGHKLIDVFSLIIALAGFSLSRRQGGRERDFRRISAGIALVNALILLVAVGIIVAEALGRIRVPGTVDGAAVSWTAGVGILVSGLSAWLLMHYRSDINTRAAFLHMATDSLLSLGVVLSGIAISLTGIPVIDPLVSLLVATVILFNTVRLILDAVRSLRSA